MKIITILEENEINNFELIKTKKDCAQQAIYNIPIFLSEREVDYCIKSAIDAYGAYTWLEEKWWSDIKHKYQIDKDKLVYVNFDTGELYIYE